MKQVIELQHIVNDSPNNGDVWYQDGKLKFVENSTTTNFSDLGGVTGAADIPLSANSIIVGDSGGDGAELTIAASRIVARLASGDVKAATAAEVKTLLGLTASTGWTAITGSSSKAGFDTIDFAGIGDEVYQLAKTVAAMQAALIAQGLLIA